MSDPSTPSDQILVCHACGALNRAAAGKDLTTATCGKCKAALATPAPVAIDGAMLARLQARDTGAYVVDIWAPWCGPCRMMAPAYEASAASLAARIRHFKLDSDQNQAAAAALNIRGVPTLIAYAGGRKMAQQAGAMTGSVLSNWIQSSLTLKGTSS